MDSGRRKTQKLGKNQNPVTMMRRKRDTEQWVREFSCSCVMDKYYCIFLLIPVLKQENNHHGVLVECCALVMNERGKYMPKPYFQHFLSRRYHSWK